MSKAKKAKKNLGDNAFCRNPDGSETIWCYTTDPNTRWEPCAPRNSTVYAGCSIQVYSGLHVASVVF